MGTRARVCARVVGQGGGIEKKSVMGGEDGKGPENLLRALDDDRNDRIKSRGPRSIRIDAAQTLENIENGGKGYSFRASSENAFLLDHFCGERRSAGTFVVARRSWGWKKDKLQTRNTST